MTTTSVQALPDSLRALYPFQGKSFDRGGNAYHYLDEGGDEAGQKAKDREPIVMLHGNPTWSFYFRRVVHALSPSWRCIVPDHIGCGLSARPKDAQYGYRLKDRIDDLEALLESLGIKSGITLLVHDWGGMIGMGYATRHPERIKRLIITNTSGFRLPNDKALPWSIRLSRSQVTGPALVRGLNAFSRGAVRSCVTKRRLTSGEAAGYLAPYSTWSDRRAVLRFVQDIPLSPKDPSWQTVVDIESRLGQLGHVPTQILWGARDFVFDDTFLAGWRRHLPNAEVHRYSDAGHYLFEDEPDATIARIQQFLATNR